MPLSTIVSENGESCVDSRLATPSTVNSEAPLMFDADLETNEVWVPRRKLIPGVPFGFEYLQDVDYLHISQTVESRGTFCGASCQYYIRNEEGELIYTVAEECNCCERQICGPHRGNLLFLSDRSGSTVMIFVKPWRCDAFWIPFWYHKLMVQLPEYTAIGWIRQRFGVMAPVFDVVSNIDNLLYRIAGGPSCPIRCPTEVNFHIFKKQPIEEEDDKNAVDFCEDSVGEISKFNAEREELISTIHEDFFVKFPEDATPIEKALILGGAFLLNFEYFEIS